MMDKTVEIESVHPSIEVGRGMNGDLLLVQVHTNADGTTSRSVLITEMRHALKIAASILVMADSSYLNPIKPPMYDELRKHMN